jgi:hypothetical protein
MALLSLGEGVLSMVMLDVSQFLLAGHPKIYHNGIGIMLEEVTNVDKHCHHCLVIPGPSQVVLARSLPFRIPCHVMLIFG